MEGFEIARFRRAAARLFNVNMRITRTTAILPPLMEAVGGVALVGALFYGSHSIKTGRLTPGAFVSFLAALFAMYTPIKRLSRVNATLQGALAAGERIFEVLDTHEEIREAEDAKPLARMKDGVEYREVGFRYSDSSAAVVRNVSFTARSGEVLAIVGTSGAGKTTLVNLLPRFYDVTEGAILIDGVDVRAPWPACASRSASSPRRPCSSTTPCAPTSPTASTTWTRRGSSRRRARPSPTTSSSTCPAATTP